MYRAFLLLSLFFILNTNLFAENKSLKIAITKDMKPFTYIDKNEKAKGILVDYWKLWSKKTNQKIKFIAYTWEESLEAIKNNKVDIHSGLYKNLKREKYLTYYKKIYNTKSNIHVFKEDKYTFTSINDLDYSQLGLIKGSYYEDFFRQYYPNIELKTYKEYKDLDKAVKNKELDVFIDDSLILWMNITKYFDYNALDKINNFELKNWFYAAVNKNNKSLEKVILKGMNNISKNELLRIEEKWVAQKRLRYLDKAEEEGILSEEENNFLNIKQDIILASVKNSKGFSYLNKKNELVGLHVDLINILNKNIKSKIQIKIFDTWEEAYNSAKNGFVDGVFFLSWSKQREKIFNYSIPYHFNAYNIIVRADEKNIKSIEDFNNRTSASVKKSIISSIIKKRAKSTNLKEFKNPKEALQALSENKVDVAFLSVINTEKLIDYNLKVSKKVYLREGEFNIGVHKSKAIISSIINKGMKSISKVQLKELKNKWLNNDKYSIFTKEELYYIKNAKTLKVGVDSWEPIEFSKNNISFDGIAGDIFKRISDISSLKFEVVVDTWTNVIKKLKNKEIDIIPAMVQNKQRDQFALFTQKYLNNKSAIFINEENKEINGFKDLEGKKLAVIKSIAAIKEIEKKFPKIEIVELSSLDEIIIALQNKKVSAFLALEINAKIKIKELLIRNIKVLYQNDITNLHLKIASRKDHVLLNSILKKSLFHISTIERNQIISKWLSEDKFKKSLNIALKLGREPFVLDKTYLKGIEYDLIKTILEKDDITINSSTNMSLKDLHKNLKKDNGFDILVNVKEKNKDFYYSNTLIVYQNVAISRKSDNLVINQIKDLKNKKIIAFEGASKFLQKEYRDIFTLKTKKYKEEVLQEKQVKDFLNKKSDLIILDKNIFKWFLKKHSNKNINKYKIDFIFTPNNTFKLAFKDKKIRDIFNINLKKIKEEGKYQEIINNYLEENILQKVKINTFISSLLSKHIFNNEIKEINKILKVLSSMSYINKIEVYSNKLLASSNSSVFNKHMKHDAYYTSFNIPKKVGYVKVYYDDSKMKEAENNLHLVPDIENFENLKSYTYIKKTYKQFDYLKKELLFTKNEKEFIKNNPIINFSSLNWEPLSIVGNSKFTGLIGDYMKIIEEKTSLNFKFVKVETWNEILKEFENSKIDFIPSVANSKEYKKLGLLSKEYENFKFSIVTKKDGTFVNTLKSLEGKTLAIPTFYTPFKYIKKNYPSIKVIGTKNIKEALTLVSNNNAHAFIGHEVVSVFYIEKFFPELKIVGLTEDKFNHHFLISKDKQELQSIINKVLNSLSYEDKLKIRDKWIKHKINLAVDYSIVYQIVIVFIIILLIAFYFVQKLRLAKQRIQEQKDNFEKLFNDTSDGLLLMRDNIFIECNVAALKLLKYKNKKDLLNLRHDQISPALQPDGQNSKKKSLQVTKECKAKGSMNFEWVHIKSTGEHCWLDITLTLIVLNHEDIMHVLWRDITNKKVLQEQVKRRNEELEDSNKELELTISNLNTAQEQLIDAEKMASLGGLVAGVAHEINTPVGIGLTGITHLEEISKDLYTKYKNDTMSQEEFEEFLDTSKDLNKLIHSNLNKAATLVKSFKQVAVDQSSEELRTFNISSYMKEILTSIHAITKKTNINIKYTCDEDININSYPGSFSQIISNLIMNSIIHGFKEKEKGNIEINIKKDNNKIEIFYKDNGIGIRKDNLNKIFDPFFTTNRENGGSGLGLNIIYNIITSKLHGSISCKSEENKGVEFLIILKLKESEK